jgi:hypothetical protein
VAARSETKPLFDPSYAHVNFRRFRAQRAQADEGTSASQAGGVEHADRSGADIAYIKVSMNPFDAIAAEEAVRLKEQGRAQGLTGADAGSSAGVGTPAGTLPTPASSM